MNELRDIVNAAAIKVADHAKVTAKAHNPRMNPDSLAMIWANTYQSARKEIQAAYAEGFAAGQASTVGLAR